LRAKAETLATAAHKLTEKMIAAAQAKAQAGESPGTERKQVMMMLWMPNLPK